MTRNRFGQVLLAAAAVLAFAGCTAAGATDAPSTQPAQSAAVSHTPRPAATPTPTAVVTPTPTPEPTPTPGASSSPSDAGAVAIVKALGGTVPSGGAVARSPDPATPGTYYKVGDWTVGWDTAGQLAAVSVAPSTPGPLPGAPVTEAVARTRAKGYLTALGVTLGTPDLFYQNAEKSWQAQWYGRIGGVSTPQDVTLMILGADGTFVSYRHYPAPAAGAPTP